MNCQEGQRPPSGRACSSKPATNDAEAYDCGFVSQFYRALSFFWKGQAVACGRRAWPGSSSTFTFPKRVRQLGAPSAKTNGGKKLGQLGAPEAVLTLPVRRARHWGKSTEAIFQHHCRIVKVPLIQADRPNLRWGLPSAPRYACSRVIPHILERRPALPLAAIVLHSSARAPDAGGSHVPQGGTIP